MSSVRTPGLTPEAFDRLLVLLNPDRRRAAEEYELLRQVLIRFFQWRGWADAEDLADEVFDRVARRLSEDVEIHNPRPFFYGVARRVHLERREHSANKVVPLDSVPALADANSNPSTMGDRDACERDLERRHLYTSRCLQELPPEARRLFLDYHQGEGSVRIARRKRLASELGVSMNALRIRISRIAEDVATCVERHLAAVARLRG